MKDFNNEWIEIFEAGDYGKKGNYPAAELDAMVRNFQPATHEPPLGVMSSAQLQLGHADDAPAVGWMSALRRDGGKLLAQFKQVHPKVGELVASGAYKKRSVGIYRDPQGGGPMIRHVALLGAVPPEVKGLKDVHFTDGEFVAIDFTEEEQMSTENQLSKEHASFLTSFAEKLKKLFGGEPAQATGGLTEEQVTTRFNQLFTEKSKPLSDEIAALKAENQALRQAGVTANASARRSRWTTFVEGARKAGKLVPALEAKLAPLAEIAIAGSPAKVRFTEGTGKDAKQVEKEVDPLDQLIAYAEAQGVIVPTGDVAGEAQRAHSNVVEMKFNETAHIKVDEESRAINARAEAIAADLRKQDPKLSDFAAFKEGLQRAYAEASAVAAHAGGMTAGKA